MTIPKIIATVRFRSRRDGRAFERHFEIGKDEINDLPWFVGNADTSGDEYFDLEFESDDERFMQRVEDCIHGLLWSSDPVTEVRDDAELNGTHPQGISYDDRLSFDVASFRIEDFYPDR